MIVTFISQCEKKSKRPNSDIEYETIAQSLYAPSNSKKQHITNTLPEDLKSSLPSVEEIEKEINHKRNSHDGTAIEDQDQKLVSRGGTEDAAKIKSP